MNSFLASIQVLSWWIAAQAIATGATLLTNDKAFAQVDELTAIVNWATDL